MELIVLGILGHYVLVYLRWGSIQPPKLGHLTLVPPIFETTVFLGRKDVCDYIGIAEGARVRAGELSGGADLVHCLTGPVIISHPPLQANYRPCTKIIKNLPKNDEQGAFRFRENCEL